MIANVRRWVEATEQRADQYLFQPLPDIVKDIIIIVDFIANTIRFEVCFGGRWRRERRRAGKKIRLEERLAEKRYSRPTRERYLWREKRYADGAVKDMAGKKINTAGRSAARKIWREKMACSYYRATAPNTNTRHRLIFSETDSVEITILRWPCNTLRCLL